MSYYLIFCIHIHKFNIGRSVKIHLYWAMNNCGDSSSKPQELILNIPCHYQVHLYFHNNIMTVYLQSRHMHSKCPSTSFCHTPAYTPSKIKLDNEKAIESLRQQLKSTYIYCSAEDFAEWGLYMYSGIIAFWLSTVLVSWHLLGWILQSPAVDILAKAKGL